MSKDLQEDNSQYFEKFLMIIKEGNSSLARPEYKHLINKVINNQDENGKTLLAHAVETNNLNACERIIGAGALCVKVKNPNMKAIFYALESYNFPIIELLINKKTDINISGAAKNTPLIFVAKNNLESSLKVTKFLLEKNADINKDNIKGYSALTYAVENNNIKMVELLLNYKANPNQTTVQQTIITREEDNILPYNENNIVSKDVLPTVKIGKLTPLMIAASKGNGEVAKLLLIRGANILSKDACNKTCIDYATENKFYILANYLKVQEMYAITNTSYNNIGCSFDNYPLSNYNYLELPPLATDAFTHYG